LETGNRHSQEAGVDFLVASLTLVLAILRGLPSQPSQIVGGRRRRIIRGFPVAVAMALLVGVAPGAVHASSSESCPADDSGQCDQTWLANQSQVGGSDGVTSEGSGGFDAYTRCWHITWHYGRGILTEARRMYMYTKWCAKNSKITYWNSNITWTNGALCHGEGTSGPYVDGGGMGTAAIYIHGEVHFACQVTIFKIGITVHPKVWLDIRYGVQGVSTVNYWGADYV
jgi:hypothetical protein